MSDYGREDAYFGGAYIEMLPPDRPIFMVGQPIIKLVADGGPGGDLGDMGQRPQRRRRPGPRRGPGPYYASPYYATPPVYVQPVMAVTPYSTDDSIPDGSGSMPTAADVTGAGGMGQSNQPRMSQNMSGSGINIADLKNIRTMPNFGGSLGCCGADEPGGMGEPWDGKPERGTWNGLGEPWNGKPERGTWNGLGEPWNGKPERGTWNGLGEPWNGKPERGTWNGLGEPWNGKPERGTWNGLGQIDRASSQIGVSPPWANRVIATDLVSEQGVDIASTRLGLGCCGMGNYGMPLADDAKPEADMLKGRCDGLEKRAKDIVAAVVKANADSTLSSAQKKSVAAEATKSLRSLKREWHKCRSRLKAIIKYFAKNGNLDQFGLDAVAAKVSDEEKVSKIKAKLKNDAMGNLRR